MQEKRTGRICCAALAAALSLTIGVTSLAAGPSDMPPLEIDGPISDLRVDSDLGTTYTTNDGTVTSGSTDVTVSVDSGTAATGNGTLPAVTAIGSGSSVTVYGDVASAVDYAARAQSGADITVHGNVSGDFGASSENGSTLIVEGNISGRKRGILTCGGSTVVVEGTVMGTYETIHFSDDGAGATVIAGSIEKGSNGYVSAETGAYDPATGLGGIEYDPDSVMAKINYIVNWAVTGAERSAVTVEGTRKVTVDESHSYDCASENDVLSFIGGIKSIAFGTSDGAGNSAFYDASTGKWTVTVRRGGGLTDIRIAVKPMIVVAEPTVKASIRHEALAVNSYAGLETVSFSFSENFFEAQKGSPLTVEANVTSGLTVLSVDMGKVSVEFDGIKIDPSNYSLEISGDGKIHITFSADLIRTLSPGSHALRVSFLGRGASASIMV